MTFLREHQCEEYMKKKFLQRCYSHVGYLLLLFWILAGSTLAQQAEPPVDKHSYPSPVPHTGQTNSWATGDDGNLHRGINWPVPRFSDNQDGTVTDNLTGLIWLKDADCFNNNNWSDSLVAASTLKSGDCGLSDGSKEGEWRLPNILELESLRDINYSLPALSDTKGTAKWSEGKPFEKVRSSYYWSSSTNTGSSNYAWYLHLGSGSVFSSAKNDNCCLVWPVRGGSR
jgi:hypothetical protein